MIVLSLGAVLVLPAVMMLGGGIYHLSEAADALRGDRQAAVFGRIACAAIYLSLSFAWLVAMLRDVASALRF